MKYLYSPRALTFVVVALAFPFIVQQQQLLIHGYVVLFQPPRQSFVQKTQHQHLPTLAIDASCSTSTLRSGTTTTLLRTSYQEDDQKYDEDDLPDFDLPEEQEEKKARRMQEQAAQLRQQIREMEQAIAASRSTKAPSPPTSTAVEPALGHSTLRNRRILVAGANGRLGSMVCRYLLRNYPELQEVVAAVHTVGESSTRGYGRLSYEVGAEDGQGTIGAFWNGQDERTASFVYDGQVMEGYNLQKLRIVEVELLDPVQCQTICEGVDAVIYCATDFNGNKPRALGLDIAFLFRAVASPTKGRVEIEGLENMLGGLKLAKSEGKSDSRNNSENNPIEFVLVSMVPEAYQDFETPFGEFNAIKREAEKKLAEYPSLTSTALQLGRFNDNFVEEDLPVTVELGSNVESGRQRQINRRDAAKAAVDALLKNDEIAGKVVQIYSTVR